MAQPLLTARHRDGITAVFRLSGATPTMLGLAVGAPLDAPSAPTTQMSTNRVIQFQGEIYALFSDGIYKLNQGTGVWSKAVLDGGLTFSAAAPASEMHLASGLYYAVVDDVPRIFGVYPASSGPTDWRGVSLFWETRHLCG